MRPMTRTNSRSRRLARIAAPLAVAVGMVMAPATAGAAPFPGSANTAIDGILDRAPAEIRDAIDPLLPPNDPAPALSLIHI